MMPLAAVSLRRAVALAVARGRSPSTMAVSGRLRRRLDDLEYRSGDDGNAAAEYPLDVAQQSGFVARDQRDGFARGAGAAGAADAMHVILRHVGQFVIDHLRQLLDVETAGRHFGGHQGGDLSALEHVERLDARGLALIAVNGRRLNAGALQLLGQPIRAMLGARENQHLPPLAFLDQMHQQMPLLFLLHPVRPLFDQFDRRVARRDLDRLGIVQQPFGQAANVVRVGGGEQQVLPLLRQQLDDLADVVDEAHVEHAIGLVEHQHLDLGEIHAALLRKIEEPAGSRHQDVAAAAQGGDLRIDAHAAEYLVGAQLHVLAVVARALSHLCGKLAGRGQHQRAGRAAGAVAPHRRRDAAEWAARNPRFCRFRFGRRQAHRGRRAPPESLEFGWEKACRSPYRQQHAAIRAKARDRKMTLNNPYDMWTRTTEAIASAAVSSEGGN